MLLMIISGFNIYIEDLVMHEGGATKVPKRLVFNDFVAIVGFFVNYYFSVYRVLLCI